MSKRIFAALLCVATLCLSWTVLAEGASFTAGTYTATVDGRNGPLTVEVTFTDDAIASVTVTEHTETAGISDSAIANIPALIVDAQLLNVDTVSGATITSEAIIAAVADCAAQAGADPSALQAEAVVSYEKSLTPGTYTAASHGHHSDVVVEVVLTENAIESVKIVEEGETYNLSDAALNTIPDAIVANQSVGIDAVTGATYTSRAILSAVENCLEQAGGTQAVLAFSTKVESEPWSTEEISETYDVVVVGSGLSGISAALAAQDEGANVVLLEKLPFWGGVSQATHGALAFGTEDNKNTNDVYNFLMQRYIGIRQGDTYMNGKYPLPQAVQRLQDESYDALQWMENYGVKFVYGEMVNLRYGRINEAGAVEDVLTNLGRVVYDENVEAPDLAGMGMKHMFDGFLSNGGTLYLNTTAESLITDDKGAVVGVKATGKGGHYTFTAGSVVLCAGGFGASEEMIELLAPYYAGEHNVTLSGNTGDGIRMAMEIGAAVYDDQFMMGGAGHTILTDADMIAEYTDNLTPKTSLYVNPNGMRVNSENPDNYTNSTLHVNPDSRDYYWVIINEANAAAAQIDSSLYIPAREVGTFKDMLDERLAANDERFFKADTVAELAKQIGIVPSTLMYSLNRYNQMCEKGEDTDLFKAANYLVAMEEGPYYAVKAYMTYFGTVGGVVTDADAKVLREDGSAIPGLYAAGENSNHNFYNNCYAGAWSLGECLTYGRIAGTGAAQEALAK